MSIKCFSSKLHLSENKKKKERKTIISFAGRSLPFSYILEERVVNKVSATVSDA